MRSQPRPMDIDKSRNLRKHSKQNPILNSTSLPLKHRTPIPTT